MAISCLGSFCKDRAATIPFAGPFMLNADDISEAEVLSNTNIESHIRLCSLRSPRPAHLLGPTSQSLNVLSKRRKGLANSLDSHNKELIDSSASRARLGGLSRVDTDPSMIQEYRHDTLTLNALMDPLSNLEGRVGEDRTLMRQSSYSALTSPRSPATAGDILLTRTVTSAQRFDHI